MAIAFMVRLLSPLKPWMLHAWEQGSGVRLLWPHILLCLRSLLVWATSASCCPSCSRCVQQRFQLLAAVLPQLGHAIEDCAGSQLIQTSGAEARRASLFREQIMTLEAWMKIEALPHNLRHKIRCYFSGMSGCVFNADARACLQCLPYGLETGARA